MGEFAPQCDYLATIPTKAFKDVSPALAGHRVKWQISPGLAK